MNDVIQKLPIRFRFAGQEDVFHDVRASDILPVIVKERSYEKVFFISSRTLNNTTNVVRELEKCLGSKVVGITDKVGEHSPMNNVIEAAKQIKASGADVIVAIGGGSVDQLDEMAPIAMKHPLLSHFNIRPLDSKEKVREVLALGE